MISVTTLIGPSAVLADDGARKLAEDALSVFEVKCVACHGPKVAKPRGRFGYVTDLARVAANREMIVPGAPDESELWHVIKHNEMPPADSPTGVLSPEQKEAIRSWIAGGAPAPAKIRK
jgi:mono/diheme cytochrome c family protein